VFVRFILTTSVASRCISEWFCSTCSPLSKRGMSSSKVAEASASGGTPVLSGETGGPLNALNELVDWKLGICGHEQVKVVGLHF
jgi:hypothetical protein